MSKISELLKQFEAEEGDFAGKIVKNNAIPSDDPRKDKSTIDLAFVSKKKFKGPIGVPNDAIAITADTKLSGVKSLKDLKVGTKVKVKFKNTPRGLFATELEV